MPKPIAALPLAALPAAPDLAARVTLWLTALRDERRLSAKTVEAYARDVRQFLAFLAERFEAPADVADFTGLPPADIRAFLARRRAEKIDPRSLQRALSALRSLARHLERTGAGRASAFSALRSPKAGRRLPRPLGVDDARAVAASQTRDGEARDPWIIARDAAVLALCYGAGLRIGEALSIRRDEAPVGDVDQLTVLGKGNKVRVAPIIKPVRAAVEAYLAALPLRLEAAGPAVRRRQGRPALARASCKWRWSACAARSDFPTARRRTRCAIPSPPIFSRAAAICARSRNCSATPRCRRRKSTPPSTGRA